MVKRVVEEYYLTDDNQRFSIMEDAIAYEKNGLVERRLLNYLENKHDVDDYTDIDQLLKIIVKDFDNIKNIVEN